MTFHPTCDLITFTKINTGWETESRKRLLAQKWVTLSPQNITYSHSIINLRGNRLRNLCISNFKNSCPEVLIDFLSNNGHKVTNFKIHLSIGDPQWVRCLQYLSSLLPNLTALQIVVVTPELKNSGYFPPPQKPHHFWKVRKLGIVSPVT